MSAAEIFGPGSARVARRMVRVGKGRRKRRPTRYGCMTYDLDAFSESVAVSRAEVVFLAF